MVLRGTVKERYDGYFKEAGEILAREKTALMSMPNTGNPLDPEDLALVDEEETIAFWEKSKCLTL